MPLLREHHGATTVHKQGICQRLLSFLSDLRSLSLLEGLLPDRLPSEFVLLRSDLDEPLSLDPLESLLLTFEEDL